ncbi:MAG: HEAT repeat domain-containing protein, partial [Phycisphaerae bacterium]|nr:HEAT repeat domain-containing protein [Phycisphaerae bacterium]
MARWMALTGALVLAALAVAQDATTAPGTGPSSAATTASAPAFDAGLPSASSRPEPVEGSFGAATWPASQPSEADRLAADSLRHSAMSMIHARWGTRGRAGRLVALAAYAQRLLPGDLQTAWVLSSIYVSRQETAAAEEVMLLRLRAEPNDFALGTDYIRVGLAARAKPSDRQAFLQSIMDNPGWPDALRAQAAVEQGKAFMFDRANDQAVPLFTRALELDKMNADALQGLWGASETQPPVEESVRAMVAMLAGSPRAMSLLRALASSLAVIGLHEQAAPLFDAMWDDAVTAAGGGAPPVDVAGQYLNALLDSGRAERAVQVFQPLREYYAQERGVMFMLIEAHRALGQTDQANQVAQQIISGIESASSGSQLSLSDAAELAWTYTVYLPKPDLALSYARQVAQTDPSSTVFERLLGAAELLSGDPALVEAGQQRLEKVRDKDPAAPALLAERYLALGDTAAASAAIAEGVRQSHSGWTYRRIRDLAAKHKLSIPPHASAEPVRQVLQQLDPRILEMGRHPEKFLYVTLRALTSPWQVGEGLQIEAVLTSTGSLPVPLWDGGLIRPTMSLEATVRGLTQERFGNLPMVIWPAPKYLPPGESVRTVVRIDVGELEYFLARSPLEDVELTVTGRLDPVQRGREIASSVPTVTVAPLVVTRRSLLGDFDRNDAAQWVSTYRYSLRVLMTDLLRGDLPRRMRAVRQLAELVTLVRDVQLFKTRLPNPLKGVVSKPVLLAMVGKVMQDPSEAVRAEMVAALGQASLDEDILKVLSPAATDSSPLVRFRLVELLSAGGEGKAQKTIDLLARDADALVRQMASA